MKTEENHSLIDLFKETAVHAYEAAKKARIAMVRLAPQYRKKDRYNAEGEFLSRIKFCMAVRKTALRMVEKFEKQNAIDHKITQLVDRQ